MEILHLTDLDAKKAELGNVDGYHFFSPDLIPCRDYILCKINGKVAGMIQFTKNSIVVPGSVGVGFVEVNTQFRGNGVAKAMIKKLIEYARSQHKPVRPGRFTYDGEMKIKPVFEKLSKEIGVKLV